MAGFSMGITEFMWRLAWGWKTYPSLIAIIQRKDRKGGVSHANGTGRRADMRVAGVDRRVRLELDDMGGNWRYSRLWSSTLRAACVCGWLSCRRAHRVDVPGDREGQSLRQVERLPIRHVLDHH